MEARAIKEYIYQNEKIEDVLKELGMHHIKWHSDKYITCGMPDGDNPVSTTVYNDSFLSVIAYTRDIKDDYGISDILSLVTFVKQCYFSEAINWLCSLFGLDYYDESFVSELSIDYISNAMNLLKLKSDIDEKLKPIDEKVLTQYLDYNNTDFRKDNISDDTQTEFELMVDIFSRRAVIPIRDELGNLVGVKGRLIFTPATDTNPKYLALIPYPKAKVLYGLYKTLPYIKENNEIIICESEKGVMQLWDMGVENAVGIGGHCLSDYQLSLIIRTGVANVVIAYDKDVTKDEVLKEAARITPYKKVKYIIDEDNILDEKESPMDNPEKWRKLYQQRKIAN